MARCANAADGQTAAGLWTGARPAAGTLRTWLRLNTSLPDGSSSPKKRRAWQQAATAAPTRRSHLMALDHRC
eukprot:2553210-Alexandrium_andersonii.AAC.1